MCVVQSLNFNKLAKVQKMNFRDISRKRWKLKISNVSGYRAWWALSYQQSDFVIPSHVFSKKRSKVWKFKMIITRNPYWPLTSKFYLKCSFSMFFRAIMKKILILKILGKLDFNFENHHMLTTKQILRCFHILCQLNFERLRSQFEVQILNPNFYSQNKN